MATNNIKPFATSSSANVLNDTELASRSELQTGFPFKSKADSKLVGKLMQNATAGAYAVGEFSAKYGTTDITGSDATGFATAFESALQAYVNEKAPSPDLSAYVTKENATLTGTATLNGQNIATVNQIPDTSHFVTDTTLANYPTSETVEAEFSSYDKNIKAHIESELTGYASLTGAAFSGAVTVQEPTAASNPATKQYVDSAVASVYKYRGSVDTQASLPSSDQTIGDVYNVEDTGDNFAWDGTKWDKLAGTVDLSSYLTIANASATYQPKGDYATTSALAAKADASALANYAPLANPAFTGTATLGGKNLVTADQIPDTSGFATKNELSGYLSLTEGGNVLGGVYYHSGVEFNGNVTITGTATLGGQNIATVNQIPDVSTKINISGSRGTLAGYETTSVGAAALTVNQDSPDSQQLTAAVAITVSDGTANQSWVKKVSIKDAGTTISLGASWKWAGGFATDCNCSVSARSFLG